MLNSCFLVLPAMRRVWDYRDPWPLTGSLRYPELRDTVGELGDAGVSKEKRELEVLVDL